MQLKGKMAMVYGAPGVAARLPAVADAIGSAAGRAPVTPVVALAQVD